MLRPRVLCLPDMTPAPDAVAVLQGVAEVDLVVPEPRTVMSVIDQYDACIACLRMRLDQSILEKAQRLKVVATPTTGLDHIDLPVLAQRGIELISLTHDYDFLNNVTSTAENAWGLLVACARKIPVAFDAVKRGEWSWQASQGRQLSGKTLGILGYGRLGKMVAQYGLAFRMSVLACDPIDFSTPGVRRIDLESLLSESDVLSVHVHLTDQTRHLLNRNAFEMMKPGIVIINTSRGAVIDEHALLEALQTSRVSACGLDVIDGEWRPDLIDHPLIRWARTHDNVVITPHIGGLTLESRHMALMHTARKLANYLTAQQGCWK